LAAVLRPRLVLLLLVLAAVWALRRLFRRALEVRAEERPGGARVREMVLDPVCATYVVKAAARVTARGGRVVHFCSAECERRWLAAAARTA
jgi:YHS domain-containing protein